MTSRKRSSIWIYFEDSGAQKARCKICNNILANQGGSTSNLRRHLRGKHPATALTGVTQENPAESTSSSAGTVSIAKAFGKCQRVIAAQRTKKSRGTRNLRPSKGPIRQGHIDEELVKMMALDLQPFSIVDDRGFRRFLRVINPTYILPNRKTLSATLLPPIYDKMKAELMGKVSRASAACLSMDCWTSRTTRFMSVTCHYIDEDFKRSSCLLDCFSLTDRPTADNLAAELQQICEEWGLTNKVVACVSDNTSNVKAAIRMAGWEHVACFAHTINRIVRESLEKIQETVKKVQNIVQCVSRSAAATETLESTQILLGFEEMKLKQDVATRWNSTYHMLKRFSEQKEAITATLALVNPSLPTPTQEEWDVINDACEILKPFQEVTVEISADRYVMASKVILMARGLQKVLQRLRSAVSSHGSVIEMMDTLQEEMQNSFHQIEHVRLLAEATLLDPRFKQRAFHDAAAGDETANNLTAAAAAVRPCTQAQASLVNPSATSQPAQAASFWEDFDTIESDAMTVCNPTSTAITEMRGYLAESLIPRTDDPLGWWKARQAVYEGLTDVMKQRLCIVATSMPAESQGMFSKTGQIICERRNRLNPKKVRQVIFVHANLTTSAEK